jgi:signal transduction histidine kinase
MRVFALAFVRTVQLHNGRFELNNTIGVGTAAKIIFPNDRLIVHPMGATVNIAA